jgi:hypothetical protein
MLTYADRERSGLADAHFVDAHAAEMSELAQVTSVFLFVLLYQEAASTLVQVNK